MLRLGAVWDPVQNQNKSDHVVEFLSQPTNSFSIQVRRLFQDHTTWVHVVTFRNYRFLIISSPNALVEIGSTVGFSCRAIS